MPRRRAGSSRSGVRGVPDAHQGAGPDATPIWRVLALVIPLPMLVHLVPVVLAALLLAAHFYRAGDVALAALTLAALVLLSVRRPWAARALQAGLAIGAMEWLRTLAAFAAMRMASGQPYARLALILGAVALVTALAALAFETRAMRARYRLRQRVRKPA